jgi:hypothetical protein
MRSNSSIPIIESIAEAVERAKTRREVIDVYQVAESIRTKHQNENVALEDIIADLVVTAGPNVPIGWLGGMTSAATVNNVHKPAAILTVIEEIEYSCH